MTAVRERDDQAALADFRAGVRAWLEGAVADLGPWPEDDAAMTAFAQRFARARFDAGYAGIGVPRAYGGQGLSAPFERIYAEEAARVPTPVAVFGIGVNMVGPTLVIAGSEQQKQRFLTPLLRGDEVWCQLFSEPGAGSDLASLTTSAVPVAGGWRIEGQKTWTSHAHHADFGLLLARTDPTAAKHAGLTVFLLPMRQPGVTVRPIKDMSGARRFSEVFLDHAFVPDENRVGEVDDGWRVAASTLTVERVAVGGIAADADHPLSSTALMALARRNGAAERPEVRAALVALHVHETTLSLLAARLGQEAAAGQHPGPRGSVGKVVKGEISTESARVARLVMGRSLLGWPATAAGDAALATAVCAAPALSIAGGTAEIQRNIIAERVLGLPR